MRPTLLTGSERQSALGTLTAAGWAHDPARDAVAKTFRFADFNAAFGWMTRVALLAEKLDHHPEWRNVWNRVEVVLTTHDVKGLTVLDLDLAQAMDRLAG
ncbi:MAG: 4a-hydroxytetrahydrobiopterin dehydratase [Rhodobacter sp.]|nr:4a-hydroxytetrahydrobiopterin dehydratase [Rhodobacter sp.]